MAHEVTTAELRAAFNRARALHLIGWTFKQAQEVPLVRWALEKSAIAHRQPHQPIQPRLL